MCGAIAHAPVPHGAVLPPALGKRRAVLLGATLSLCPKLLHVHLPHDERLQPPRLVRRRLGLARLRIHRITACGAVLLPLQPRPEAVQVEHVAAGQHFVAPASGHVLATHDAGVVRPLQLRCCGIGEPLVHVGGNTTVPQEVRHPVPKIPECPVQVPHQVERQSVVGEHDDEEHQVDKQMEHISDELQIEHVGPFAFPPPLQRRVHHRKSILGCCR
mmetsp:Transcript_17113/g.51200  ORF Transcript_17113/g.51200 Transcript_17113/m.51200 type:complete len:216 (-) Transcript_17113:622-1269(-)